jgi:hypothetical protein
MNRLGFIAAAVAGLTAFAVAPAGAAQQSATSTVTTCSSSGLQAGLSTKVCADATGNTVNVYGKIGLAGPSPVTSPKELLTTLKAEVIGSGAPQTQNKWVIFNNATIDVHGLSSSVPCGSTLRATFSVSTMFQNPNPVTLDIPVTC